MDVDGGKGGRFGKLRVDSGSDSVFKSDMDRDSSEGDILYMYKIK